MSWRTRKGRLVHRSAPVMTVGLDGATVENVLSSGLLRCPVVGCGERLAPWGWARGRVVRGAGRVGRRVGCRFLAAGAGGGVGGCGGGIRRCVGPRGDAAPGWFVGAVA